VPTVNYEVSIPYQAIPGMPGLQPAAEVELFNGNSRARAVGILDSAASHTGFSSEIATLLGIEDVSAGRRVVISTLGGEIDLYMFDLEMRIVALGIRFAAQIGFFPTHTPRNILGRIVVFSQFQIGFSERTSQIHSLQE
jgi:hypothetical protein